MRSRIACMIFGALLAAPLTAIVLDAPAPPLWTSVPWGIAVAVCLQLADTP